MKPAIIITCLLIAFTSLGVKPAVALTFSDYPCQSEDFDKSLEEATFIIMGKHIAKIPDRPDKMGVYQVSTVFKGDFNIGDTFQHSTLWPWSPDYEDTIGKHYIFWGKDIDKSKQPVEVKTWKCAGKGSTEGVGKSGDIPEVRKIIRKIADGEIK